MKNKAKKKIEKVLSEKLKDTIGSDAEKALKKLLTLGPCKTNQTKVAVRWIITLGLLISSMIAVCVPKSSIEYKDKRFLYSFEAQINARHDKVLDKLHNFEQWDRLNSNISKSKVLETLPGNKIKRLLTLTQCIFTFCFNLKFIEIVTLSRDRLEMNIVAGEGNFSAGRAIWETVSEDIQNID